MGDDRAHGSPGSDVDINGHVCNYSCVLQCVMIYDPDNSLHLTIRNQVGNSIIENVVPALGTCIFVP